MYDKDSRWLKTGCFEMLAHDLQAEQRLVLSHNEKSAAAVVDSRTLRSTPESVGRAS